MNGGLVYTEIIVPFDGGEFSARSIKVARQVAQLMDAPLRIVAIATTFARCDALTAVMQRELRDLDDVKVSWSVRVADKVVEELEKEWARNPGALLCMSSSGRPRMAPILGSVAEGVLRSMYGPVLLVGPRARCDRFVPDGAMITCSDGSSTAETVLPVAAQWAITLPLEPWVIHVSDPDGYRAPAEIRSDVTTDVTHARQVAKSLEQLVGRKVQYEALHSAHAAQAITDFAEEKKATLIAMSTHGATGLRRVALGSVTMAVVHSAPCPVLVYRPPHIPGDQDN